jgi:alkaline phosphatase
MRTHLIKPTAIRLNLALATVAVVALLAGCFRSHSDAPNLDRNKSSDPRNIIVIIGDGMGPQQLALAELYHARVGGRSANALHRFISSAAQGTHLPLPETALVNDSACAASQLAGGCRCDPQGIGLDRWGKPCKTISKRAQQLGMRVGLISDTRLSHATPAGFAAQVKHRKQEHEIAAQMVGSGFDLLLSGGSEYFPPPLLQQAADKGYRVVSDRKQLNGTKSLPVLGLFAKGHMSDAFSEGSNGEPTLAEMTDRALALLDNPRGFFLMIEAGQIDTAAHHNDAGWVLREMFRLSKVLERILEFISNRDDTLVILTADHETGGMGLSYRAIAGEKPSDTYDFLTKQTLLGLARQSAPLRSHLKTSATDRSDKYRSLKGEIARLGIEPLSADELLRITNSSEVTAHSGDSNDCHHDESLLETSYKRFYPHQQYRTPAMLGRELGARMGVVWATGGHTSTPVPILCHGAGQEICKGWFTTQSFGERLIGLTDRL